MTEPDELLARVDWFLGQGNQASWSTARQLVVGLAAALRAALAAQPQPLFEGTVDQAWFDQDESHRPRWLIFTVGSGDSVHPEQFDGQRVVVYPALAESATPTGDDE